jgi:hypothetical protein
MSIQTIDLGSTGSWALNTAAKEALKSDNGILKIECNGQIYQMNLGLKKIHLALINQ